MKVITPKENQREKGNGDLIQRPGCPFCPQIPSFHLIVIKNIQVRAPGAGKTAPRVMNQAYSSHFCCGSSGTVCVRASQALNKES